MDVLSTAARAVIRQQLKIPIDTFYKTPLVLKKRGVSMDKFKEDGIPSITSFNLICYPQYDYVTDKVGVDGTEEKFDIAASVEIDALVTAGLCTNLEHFAFSTGTDTFVVNGYEYVLRDYRSIGHFGQLGEICKLFGEKNISK